MWMGVPKTYRFDAAAKTICVEEMPRDRMLFAQPLFNTIPVDWVLRFSAAIHVTKSVLMRQPMPQPTDVELAENPVYKEMILNSLKLSLCTVIPCAPISMSELEVVRYVFGPLLRQCRVKQGFSQKHATEIACYSLRNFVKVEKGIQEPGVMTALAMVVAVKVDVRSFFNCLSEYVDRV